MKLGEDLRDSILQDAFVGKITKQKENDKSIIDKINEISKKENKTIKTSFDEKFLSVIPNNWCYVLLGDILEIARGGSPRPIKSFLTDSNDGVNWIKIGDTDIKGKYIYSTAQKIRKEGMQKSRFVKEGDFLLTNSMSFGRPYILKTSGCIHDGWLVLSDKYNMFNQDYLYWLLSSPMVFNQFSGKANGAVVKNLNINKVENTIVPIPPLEEQEKIAEKLNEVIEKIDSYSEEEKKLDVLNADFPTELRYSFIKASIMGELTPSYKRNDNEVNNLIEKIQLNKATSTNKKFETDKITDDDIPFEIPKEWKWVRLGDLAYLKIGKTPPRSDNNCWGKDYSWISIADMKADGYVSDTKEGITKYAFEKYFSGELIPINTLIMSFKLTIGRVSIIDIPAIHNEAIISIFPYYDENYTIRNYLFKILPFISQFGNTKNAIKGTTLNSKSLNNLLIPLPSISEQKKIVEKLEFYFEKYDEIMEIIEENKKE